MSDPRFARVKSDPRFRRFRKKESKVIVDERFKGVFAVGKTKKVNGQVDKYGRSISSTHDEDNLKRFYRLDGESNEERPQVLPDYARGEVLLKSSDEENDDTSESGEDSDSTNIVKVGSSHRRPIVDNDQAEVNLDEGDLADLDAQVIAYNEAYPDISQDEGLRSRRLAIVNLDWDHVRAGHIYKICSSLLSPTASTVLDPPNVPTGLSRKHSMKTPSTKLVRGKVVSVRIYPSEFGKERMAREEIEGPPTEIFNKTGGTNEEVTPQSIYNIGGENDYNEDALRNYQLERLRYYYGIITCNTIDAASHIYQELDGTELERSANVFDLSFVPEGMVFDDACKDEVTAESTSNFKPIDFVTDALRHSRVKLTWDEDDLERNLVTRRRLSKKEIEDADFTAYLASDSDPEERDCLGHVNPSGTSRDKLRALLLASDANDLPEGWGRDNNNVGDVDMEVTFTPGISDKNSEAETTLDKYQQKIRDKRKERKGRVKQAAPTEGVRDDFFIGEDPRTSSIAELEPILDAKQKERESSSRPTMRPSANVEELALLIDTEDISQRPKHFNLKSVLKAENKSKRKTKKKHGDQPEDDLQEDFIINVNDDRFKALHEDHQYAIDPSNPQFKKTKAMSALLEERTQRQKNISRIDPGNILSTAIPSIGPKSLRNLVDNVKRKSINVVLPGPAKRQKVS
ncbi:hypothetical protein BDZ94DRAFT_1202746, partial [Collybia nuda]